MKELSLTVIVFLFFQSCTANYLADTGRIIGGNETSITEYPYMVSLQNNGTFFGYDFEHFCCGVIINEWWIATAAKCVDGKTPGEFHVRVGSKHYYQNGVIHDVAVILIHPKYVDVQWDYDVGVIKVLKSIQFGPTVQPAQLPASRYDIIRGTNVTIVGWGATELLGPPAPAMHATVLPVISQKSCENQYSSARLTTHMFCVFEKGYGPCVGDTGSPAIVNNAIIGLASWSQSCAYNYPTVYTNMPSVVDWIQQETSTSAATQLAFANSILVIIIVVLQKLN